ncbi:alpha/beta-hydrolase lipase region [Teratosphaeria destructans]|uniref:Alpha/beta-hydrolase lipase region n=1 Tax=Teratosphaeria destructans TaxID=418781 RepID=A0A9W7SNE8_9PEZI|nr:alpha/beta-hydrolase lipase region [Teratosphaeria destructans]
MQTSPTARLASSRAASHRQHQQPKSSRSCWCFKMPLLASIGEAFLGMGHEKDKSSIAFAQQAQRLAHLTPGQENDKTGSTQAVEAKFVTPLDPVVATANGGRLPAIPVEEAAKLNRLKDELDGHDRPRSPPRGVVRESKDWTKHGPRILSPPMPPREEEGKRVGSSSAEEEPDAPLTQSVPPSRTNPLFPPLPMYGPPSWMRTIQCWFFRAVSSVLSFYFLLAIAMGTIVCAIPKILRHLGRRARLQNPDKHRLFYDEEQKRAQERRAADRAWMRQQGTRTPSGEKGDAIPQDGEFIPTEGGPDPLVVDVAYYARRVGLDSEIFEVETEDGFIIELWHIFNPRDYNRPSTPSRKSDGPDVFQHSPRDSAYGGAAPLSDGKKKYPVLMMHGLLQCSGAFCSNDDDSLAFYLAKSGYDVWLGNNRCGFTPKHTMLSYEDPRMWAWNIRQMGVMDLAALTSRVLKETGFPKLALIAHSQGTTQTFVALAKEQRPELGEKISVFCALAPAAYAGPLIGKIYFKFMRLVPPSFFRMIFGIHAFIPLMMEAHKVFPAPFYGWIGYHIFSFLFSWSDTRWDRGLRNRMFQWAPVYVSAESMRWWLGRECFAKQKCILATREEGRLEDKEDEEDDEVIRRHFESEKKREGGITERRKLQRNLTSYHCQTPTHQHHDRRRGQFAWYDDRFPPLAMWVGGADDLVDGRRLLRRFDRGREPHVRIVHKKIIEGYEHLDVIWAMDAIEKVGKEVREVIWRTVDSESAKKCRVPVGCTNPMEADPPKDDVPMLHSGGRLRMASISEQGPPADIVVPKNKTRGQAQGMSETDGVNGANQTLSEDQHEAGLEHFGPRTNIESSREKEGEHNHIRDEAKTYGRGEGEGETHKDGKEGGLKQQPNGYGHTRRMSEVAFEDLEEKATTGHVLKLGVLVIALGGCILIQCVIIAWLCLIAIEARLLLLNAALLHAAFEQQDVVPATAIDPRETPGDAEILRRIEEREQEVQAAIVEAEAREHERLIQKAPQWKITPEALQEARSFADEATKSIHKPRKPEQPQHQKRISTVPRVLNQPPPTLMPTKAPVKPVQPQQPAQTGTPPHLRKAKEISEEKSNGASSTLQEASTLPIKQYSISELKALNPAAARRHTAPPVPPGFQPVSADPHRQATLDALLAPTCPESKMEPPSVDPPAVIKPPVSAAEIEKRRKAVLKARELYQDALSYFQPERGRSGAAKGGNKRLERAESYYREKCTALREVAEGDEVLREVGEGGGGDLIVLG